MQNLRLKGKNKNPVYYSIKYIRSCRVQNWRLGGFFARLYFHAKFRVKSKKYNQNMFTLEAILIIYTFMQNLRLKAKIL